VLNTAYIGYVGLKFGQIATQAAFFVNYTPLLFEVAEDIDPENPPAGHPLAKLVKHLKDFGMQASFQLATRKQLLASPAFAPLRLDSSDFHAWQDQSYVQRIWCIAEFGSVWLGGFGEDFVGCEKWWTPFLRWLAEGDGAVVSAFRKTIEDPNHFTNQRQANAVMLAFAAYQSEFEPEETPQAPNTGKICLHFLCFEGLIATLTPAIATVKTDVPLVLDTLYVDICRRGLQLKKVPKPLERVMHWILRCCSIGYDVPAISDRDSKGNLRPSKTPREDFLQAFEKGGLLHDYLEWTGKYFRAGANSLMWLDILVNCRRLLLTLTSPDGAAVDSSLLSRTDPFDLPAPSSASSSSAGEGITVFPDDEIPAGFRFARHAYTWLTGELGLTVERVKELFIPAWSSRGFSAFTPLTKPEPCVLGVENGVQSSHFQYWISSPNPTEGHLRHFAVLEQAPFLFLYRIDSAFLNHVNGQRMPAVTLGAPLALARSALSIQPFIEISKSSVHESVTLGGGRYGLLWKSITLLSEQTFHPQQRAIPGGVMTPIWKVKSKVADWAENYLQVRANLTSLEGSSAEAGFVAPKGAHAAGAPKPPVPGGGKEAAKAAKAGEGKAVAATPKKAKA
jgi:hypothetical protein